jgi:hypothetical protein
MHIQPKKHFVTKRRVAWFFAFVLVSTQIFFAIQISTMGGELAHLEHEQISIAKENQQMQLELVQKSSLSKVIESSETLGYQEPKHIVFVESDNTVAQLH